MICSFHLDLVNNNLQSQNCKPITYLIFRTIYTVLNIAVFKFWTKNNANKLCFGKYQCEISFAEELCVLWIRRWKILSLIFRFFYLIYQGSFIQYVRKCSGKTNISYSLIRLLTCAYQAVRNLSFSENFVYVLK